eukprot:5989534-Amphidinium_carterae.1
MTAKASSNTTTRLVRHRRQLYAKLPSTTSRTRTTSNYANSWTTTNSTTTQTSTIATTATHYGLHQQHPEQLQQRLPATAEPMGNCATTRAQGPLRLWHLVTTYNRSTPITTYGRQNYLHAFDL